MIIPESQTELLTQALFNLHPTTNNTPDYAAGILVGIITALMINNEIEFLETCEAIKPHMPVEIIDGSVPDYWINNLLN